MLDLLESFGESVTVRRMTEDGAYDGGKYVAGKTEEVLITAVVQVMNADEMMLLPEGDRLKEAIKIFTDDALNLSDNNKLRHPDVIIWNDSEFEVQKSERWLQAGLKHWKSVAVLVQVADAT